MAFQIEHLPPIGTHHIQRVGTRHDQESKPLFTLMQGGFGISYGLASLLLRWRLY